VNSAAAGPRTARVWRIAAGVLGALLILGGTVLGALRLLVAQVPENAGRVQAWIEQQTHLRVEYREVDARLRWFGPEVVLKRVRVLDRDGTQALFTTREASVGLDLWNFLRTGQFVAGRLRFEGPDITVVRLSDGHIRLLGQQERPTDHPLFDLDRLPAGRVIIDNASVTYRDLGTGRGPWRLEDLSLTLRRDRDVVVASGSAQLPAGLGGKVDFSADLQGSLQEFAHLTARVTLRVPRVVLAGWSELLPEGIAQLRAGGGAVEATVAVAQGRLQQARIALDFAGVRLELPQRQPPPVETIVTSEPHREPGDSALSLPSVNLSVVQQPVVLPREARYAALAGDFQLRRDGEGWVFRVEDLRVESTAAGRRQPQARLGGRLQGNPVTTFAAALYASGLRVEEVWPLVLAFAPHSFDHWSGLDPTGEVRSLRLDVVRPRAGAIPEFAVSADVAGLGVRPVAGLPGIGGITAVLSGTDQRGRLALRASGARFNLPRLFAEPLATQRLAADVEWRRADDAWILRSNSLAIEHEMARARGTFELTLPDGRASPVLAMTVQVDSADVRLVPRVLPIAHMHPHTLGWFETAFRQGQVTSGRLNFRGPLRDFPFRNGEGDFSATAELRDVGLNYFEGFAPLVGGTCRAEFHNQGLRVTLQAGEVGGMRLSHAEYSLDDYHHAVMKVDAAGAADLGGALTFLQGSPLGPTLGKQFMELKGSGPAEFAVNLTIPTDEAEAAQLDHQVHAVLESVAVTLPALRAPAQNVSGTFDLHKLEVRSSLHGTFLDGPFDLAVAPGSLGGGVTAAVDFGGHGHLAGAQLPSIIGLPAGIRMNGGTDWDLTGRLERHGEEDPWLTRFEVSSTLAGLEILAPAPFAKAAAEPRATRVRLEIPGATQTDLAIDSGSARARLRFVEEAHGKLALERGVARFDGQPAVLPARPGLQVAGEWPQFDLGEWLALQSGGSGPGARLSDWLGSVDVHLARAVIGGFEFRDLDAHLNYAGDTWQIGVTGPMAEGSVTVPDDLSQGRPIVLAMKRLQLESVPAAAGAKAAASTDPRTIPALSVTVDDFAWQDRHFGRVRAMITKDPQGLSLDSLSATAPSFTLQGRGGWLMEGASPRMHLGLGFSSTDLAAAAHALGYGDAIDAKRAELQATLSWPGGPYGEVLGQMDGTLHLELHDGQLRNVKPGAGRILGLLSVVDLPRRLALDFHDVTDKGLAFDSIHGDFEVREGSAFTQNLLLKGPAVDIGVVGRTGLVAEDYDQTMVVSGNPSGALAVAGALAAGPVVAAGVLVFSQLFKGQLQGLTRAYYHVTGPWSNPAVERISTAAGESAPVENKAPQAEEKP